MSADLPGEAVTAAVRRAISDPGSGIGPRRYDLHGQLESLTEWQTRAVMEAAGPVLAARAAAAERERIRQLAIRHKASYYVGGKHDATFTGVFREFADLLGGTADGAHPDGGAT